MIKKHSNAGVTLIELLVTVSLLGILIGISGDLLFTIFRAYNKASTIVNIQEQGNLIINKIKTDAINASEITVTSTKITVTIDNGNIIIYQITPLADTTYSTLTRTVDDGVTAPVEDLLSINGSAKYKIVSNVSGFDMKNVTSTPKLLIIHLNIIPANQSDTTPNDQKIAQGNSLVRTAIVLRGTYDRI